MENIGISNMKKELERLNPQVKFDVRDHSVSPSIIIYGTIPAENLHLPNGYYYNDKNGITNKHKTQSGLYECFEYKYDIDHFTLKPEVKKSWISSLFTR